MSALRQKETFSLQEAFARKSQNYVSVHINAARPCLFNPIAMYLPPCQI